MMLTLTRVMDIDVLTDSTPSGDLDITQKSSVMTHIFREVTALELFNSSRVTVSNATSYSNVTTNIITEQINVTSSASLPSQNSTNIANLIWVYFGTIVFIVGVIGNILILAVATRKQMKGTSTSNYLVIMAIGDLVLLHVGIISGWVEGMQIVVYDEISPVTCKLDKFCKYSFADCAIWIIVLFTADRCIAICNPLNKSSLFAPHTAKYYSISAVLLAFVKNLHVFWTRGAQYKYNFYTYPVTFNGTLINVTSGNYTKIDNCGFPTPAYADFENFVLPWIALVLTNIIPCILISIFNVFIVRAMIQMKKAPAIQDKEMEKRNRNVFQTAAMCLAGSISFLVCITPTIVLTVGKIYWTTFSNPGYNIAKAFNNVFFYVNYSINFFLYCLTGRKFRNTFLQLIMGKKFDKKMSTFSHAGTVSHNNNGLRGISSVGGLQGKSEVKSTAGNTFGGTSNGEVADKTTSSSTTLNTGFEDEVNF